MSTGDIEEQWKPVPGLEGLYEVSSFGSLRGLERFCRGSTPGSRRLVPARICPQHFDPYGYPVCVVSVNKRSWNLKIHVVACAAFIGSRPSGYEVCHNDGNKKNNRLSNLRYDTPAGNGRDRAAHGTHKGEKNSQSTKLNNSDVLGIRADHRRHIEIAAHYGVSASLVSKIKRKISWRHV